MILWPQLNPMKAFAAYPADPPVIGQVINAAASNVSRAICEITPWEETDIAGRPLVSPILDNIAAADVLIADVTKLNFNVTFEVGYAIGKGRRVFLTRNSGLKIDPLIDRVGIFDTLGYKTYENSAELAHLIREIRSIEPITIAAPLDRRAPLYILETPKRDDLTISLVSKIKKARLKYRSFNPAEDVRLSAIDAIQQVAMSFGVAVPLQSSEIVDAEVHNIRAAFVVGLALGMGKPFLLVQHYGGPVPMDVRDFAESIRHPDDIRPTVNEFALQITEVLQSHEDATDAPAGALSAIAIGNPMAENEFDTIGHYFLQTDQYLKAERGEVHLVVGRKGTGKTAIFGHLRNRKRSDVMNVVLDLKPEGYQLVKLREQILGKLNQGAKQHLIVAFWEYVLYLEVCNKLLEKDQKRHLADHRLFEHYNQLKARYGQYSKFNEADFSERLALISDNVIGEYEKRFGDTGRDLSANEITQLLYQIDLRQLREDVRKYLEFKKQSFVLFDNLDRGWPEGGLSNDDVLIIRCLIDASRKIQQDMRGHQLDFSCIVFLRNDVYQLLVSKTADFGKDLQAQIDWNDGDQIREMLRLRLLHKEDEKGLLFEAAWRRICVSHVDGEESSQFLIDRSLYRPRNVLKLFYHCRASAINVGREKIEEDDLRKGIATFSTDLVIEADRGISDVMPEAKGKIYNFVGEASIYDVDDLRILIQGDLDEAQFQRLLEFMIYFSILGLERAGEVKYVYDVGYDMNILRAEIAKFGRAVRYQINPAFWPALKIKVN